MGRIQVGETHLEIECSRLALCTLMLAWRRTICVACKTRIKGEIWEKWGATYGRNGYKKRSGLASGQMTMKTKKVVAIK